MRQINKIGLIISLASLAANGIFIFTYPNPGISIVGALIAGASSFYLWRSIRRSSALGQLRARLNPSKLDHPFRLTVYDTLLDKTVEIHVSHFPATITEGNVQVRIGEDQRIDVYFEGRLAQSFYLAKPLSHG